MILYGGNNNWFAAYAYWYFRLHGHGDVKLIDGGSGVRLAKCRMQYIAGGLRLASKTSGDGT